MLSELYRFWCFEKICPVTPGKGLMEEVIFELALEEIGQIKTGRFVVNKGTSFKWDSKNKAAETCGRLER